jgi:hypothetical protein
VKKAIRYALIAVLAVWVVQDPTSAAHLASNVLHWFAQAGHSVSTLASHIH